MIKGVKQDVSFQQNRIHLMKTIALSEGQVIWLPSARYEIGNRGIMCNELETKHYP